MKTIGGFSTVEEALEYFRGEPFSRVFHGSAAFSKSTWRVRNSGVGGQPELTAETLVVLTACDNLGVAAERCWSGKPINPDSFRIEAPFLDGGFYCMTGNYFYGKKGAWVKEARAACAIALELGLGIRPSWLRNYGLESVSPEELRAEIQEEQVRRAEKERQIEEEGKRRAEEEAGIEERARIAAAEKEAALRSEIAAALKQGDISGEPSFRIWHYSCGRVSDEIYVYSDKVCPRCGASTPRRWT